MNRFPSVLGVFSVLELQVETVSRFITNAHKLFQFAASRWMLPALNLAQNFFLKMHSILHVGNRVLWMEKNHAS
jgi:hypothetical protein